MKRILTAIITAAMVFALAACSSGGNAESENEAYAETVGNSAEVIETSADTEPVKALTEVENEEESTEEPESAAEETESEAAEETKPAGEEETSEKTSVKAASADASGKASDNDSSGKTAVSVSASDSSSANSGKNASAANSVSSANKETASAHTHSYTVSYHEDPTCGGSGWDKYTCSCGDFYERAIPATGEHTWDSGTVTKAATCVTYGLMTYTCSVCGISRTETIPSTEDHDLVEVDSYEEYVYDGIVSSDVHYVCYCGIDFGAPSASFGDAYEAHCKPALCGGWRTVCIFFDEEGNMYYPASAEITGVLDAGGNICYTDAVNHISARKVLVTIYSCSVCGINKYVED